MRKETKGYIGGQWVEMSGDEPFGLVNQHTEEVWCEVSQGTEDDVDAAVAAAKDAFPDWSGRSMGERLDFLEAFHDGFAAATDELIKTISAEMGAPVGLVKDLMVDPTTQTIRSTIDIAREYPMERRVEGFLERRLPLGVCAAISPWNNPALMMVDKAIAAIAAGNTVVHKPANLSPLSAFILARLADDAKFPAGVYNVVPGKGSVVGDAMARHMDVDIVTFTGSVGSGRKVAEAAATGPRKCVLELGGKSACIILDDRDFKQSLESATMGTTSNSGQLCAAWTRIIVPKDRLDEAAKIAADYAESLTIGDPSDEDTDVGPVVSKDQWDKIQKYIRIGMDEGATVATGGLGRPDHLESGFYVKPTIFSDVDNSMRIAQEEIFGPVLCIIPYDDEDHAVRIANDSDYGLHGGVLGSDPVHAEAVAKRIRTGQIDTRGFLYHPRGAWGGFKRSGYGRCLGTRGFEEFIATQTIFSHGGGA